MGGEERLKIMLIAQESFSLKFLRDRGRVNVQPETIQV